MSILIVFMLAVDVSWPVAVPITMEKNLPLVQMKVNGGEVLTFIVDSAAAGCVIDQERASALGLATSDRGVSSGSGGTQTVVLLKPVVLEAGGVEVAPPRCYGFDMRSLKFTGRVDGIIGHPLFVRYVVELDYPGLSMRLFELGSYAAPAGAEVLPMRMTTGPVVRGTLRVAGKPAIGMDMQLDTGSAHVLTVVTPFVDRHKLLAAAGELVEGKTLGFGGAAADVVGRVEEVSVGRFAAAKPTVRFSRQTTGSFGSEKHYQGNLGGGFFKAHRVVFDFAAQKLVIH